MKNYNKTISVFNGNGQRIERDIPSLFIEKFGNETAKAHFEKNTGLKLKDYAGGYITKPKTFKQLYKVFVTYNFVTTYFYNNILKLEFKQNKTK